MKTKQCPKCDSKFDYRVQFCFRDGALLVSSEGNVSVSAVVTQEEKSAGLEDALDLGEITQDITIGDLLDIKGASLGLDLDGIDFDGADFGAFTPGNIPVPSKSKSVSSQQEQRREHVNQTIDEELGVEFDFEYESDSDELGEEITGELDFDEFENTLDLDAEELARELKEEGVEMVGAPLAGGDVGHFALNVERMQTDEVLLPGDTLDLELDLETVEGIEQLKAEEIKRKRQVDVAEEKLDASEESSSNWVLVAALLGVIGAIVGVFFMGEAEKKEALKTEAIVEVEKPARPKNTRLAPIEQKVEDKNIPVAQEVPVENNVEKEEGAVEVVVKDRDPDSQTSGAQEKVAEDMPEKVVISNTPSETEKAPVRPKKDPAPMKLPTEPVPNKQKVIPKPQISQKFPQKSSNPAIVQRTAATQNINKPVEVTDEVVKADDGSIGLWGAAPAKDCYVIFNSNVSDALVFLDGRRYGSVGDKIKVVCNQKYKAKLQANGYLIEERDVQSDATKEFFVEMRQ